MDTKEHRLIFRHFNRPQPQNCNNEQMNVPKAVEKRGSGITYEALDKRIHETNAKQRALIAKFQTNPHLYLNTWKKFTPEFNKTKFQLDAIQKNRSQYSRDYCGSHLDTESKAISQLEDIITKTMAEATAIENPTKMESTTIRQSGRAEVVPGQEVTETHIPLKNYADITFDFDPVGGATVLPSVIDGRERTGAQTFGDLEKDGYTVTRKKGSHIVEVKSKVGFTYSYDQVKITTVENAVERVTEDVSNAGDAVKNFPKSPTEDPESYKIVEREVDATVAKSADIGPEVADATQAAIIKNQEGMLRPRREEVNKQTSQIEQKLYDLNRVETNDNGHDKYKLQAANQAVEDLVSEESPELRQKTDRILEDELNHLTDIVRTTKQNPDAIKSAIKMLDAFMLNSGSHNPKRPEDKNMLKPLLEQKRRELVAWLPKTEKAPKILDFESKELLVKALSNQHMDAAREFKDIHSRENGVKLADIIKSELYLMRQYKMNEKGAREKLESELVDVKKEISKMDEASRQKNDEQLRRIDRGPKI